MDADQSPPAVAESAETPDPQWFTNYVDGEPAPMSIAAMLERDAHASMYRDLYAMAQEQISRMSEELHRERGLRSAAEADRRRMLSMLLRYMTTITTEMRREDQTFTLRAKVSQWLLARARDPRMVIDEVLRNIGKQADAELSAARSPGEPTR